jgi:hypothetical protein
VVFTPTDTVNFTTANAAVVINVNKSGSAGVLAASANPVVPGNAVTLTATLSAVAPGAGTPTGTVQFLDGGSPLGSPVALSGGVAQRVTSSLSVGAHTITATYAGDGNFNGSSAALAGSLVINSPPVAGPDALERFAGRGVKVKRAALLANDTDADAHALTFQNLATGSAQGGAITESGDWIFYVPPGGDPSGDSFTYEIADPLGGVTGGTVSVQRATFTAATDNLTVTDLGNGSFRIVAHGIPGAGYQLEFTDATLAPAWQSLGGVATDAVGRVEFIDTPPGGAPARTYRMIQP